MPRAVQPPKKCGVRQCEASVLPARWDEDRQIWRSRCEKKRAGNQLSNHECWYDEDEKVWVWTSCLSKALGTKGAPKGNGESQGAEVPEEVGPEEPHPKGASNSKGRGKNGKKGSKGTQNSKGKGNAANKKDAQGDKLLEQTDGTGKQDGGDKLLEQTDDTGKQNGGDKLLEQTQDGGADQLSVENAEGADQVSAENAEGQKEESGLSLRDAGDKLSKQAGETGKGEVAPLTPEKCPKPDKWSRLDVQLEHFDRSRLGNDRPSQQEPHVTSSPRTPVKNDKGVPAAFPADTMSPIKVLERPRSRGAAAEGKDTGPMPGNANCPAAAPDAASGSAAESGPKGSANAAAPDAASGSAAESGPKGSANAAAPDAASGIAEESAPNGNAVKLEHATIKQELGKPSRCELEMVRRASEVKKSGKYLDVVDLMLHCFQTGQGMQMVTHEQSEAPLLEDFWSLANQFMGPQADLLPVKQPSRSHVKFVLCRASYEPSDGNPVGLNHFIPLWHRFELDRETIDKLLQAPDDELATLEAMLQTPMPKGSSGMMWLSFLEDTKERIARIDRFKRLQEWLAKRDLIAAEVLPDGNCAVWSLLSLEAKNPFLPAWDHKKAAEEKREEIAKKLEEASASKGWRALYSVMYDVMQPTQEEDVQKTAVKKDPGTPSKRPKPNPPIFMDLTTPPRKAKEVMVDGAQRGAYPEKRQIENPVFGAEPAADPFPAAKDKAQKADFKANVEKALGQSAQRPAAPKRKLNPATEEEEEEEDAEEEDAPKKKKKKKNRTCKVRVKQDSDKRVAAAKAYLGSIGISWLSSQAYHGEYKWKNLPQRTAFSNLYAKLLEGELPECLVCVEMLKAKEFNKDGFEAVVESATDPSKQSPVSQRLQALCEQLKAVEIQRQADASDMAEGEKEEAAMAAMAEGEKEEATDEEQDEVTEGQEEPNDNEVKNRKDVCRIIQEMGHGRFLQALPLMSHDRRVPIRCLACRSRRQPEGKVFECSRLKKDCVRHYIKQHCGPEHLNAVAEMISRIACEQKSLGEDESCGGSKEQVPCRGLSLTHGSMSQLSKYKDDFVLWVRYTKLNQEGGKHEYTFVAAREELLVQHQHCEKIVWIKPGEEATCPKCNNTEMAKLAVKCATKFSTRYWAAILLSSKLFKGEEHTESLISSLKATHLYNMRKDSLEAVIPPAEADTASLQKLQKFVRMSWTRTPKENHTELSMAFMVEVVNPVLSVNTVDCTGDMQKLANQFTSLISSQNFEPDSLEALNLRILKGTAGGKLSQNPAAMGIVLQCLELIGRSERGVSMKKRRKMGDREEGMVHEAAMLLASNGCSAELMQQMGFNKESTLKTHNRLDNLLEQSLPCPALSLLFPGIIERNMQLIDSIIPRQIARRRRMCVAFDFTYLTPIHSTVQLHGKKALVGSPFTMKDLSTDAPGSFQQILQGREMGNRVKANRMLELVVWDPSSSSLQCWSPMSLPLSLKYLNTDSTDSSWEVFRMLDAFADRASEYCKLFICDGEACNSILKSAICGQLSPELKRKMFQTKFFSRLRHVPIQGLEELPHFPIRSCFLDDGDPIFCMPGSAHAVKNAAGQVCSETKVPYFGRHFCDATGALEFSLPIPAYVRKDGMSDRLSSLLANPFFLMRLRDDTEGAQVDIPWHLRGMLLWNVSTAMCVAPAVHGALTLATRCELAICGHICYDLWALTSSQREKEQNVAKGKFQLAHQTRRNLQAVALSTVAMCASKSDDWDAFRHPHGLSEIHIERFFGRLRAYSASGDLSARQLWNAEAVQMRRLSKTKPAGHVPTAAEETPLNAAQLRSCAQNALNAALQLVSQASGIASGNLLREYMAESVGDFFEIEEEETINEDLLGEGQVDEVRAVLHQIEQVAADEHRNEAALDESEAPPHDADLELPDGLALVELTSHDPADTAAAKEISDMENFPQTLKAALAKDGNIWSNLWQLAVFLRCSVGGMDSAYLKKGEVIRQRARKLNWHQTLEHELKEIREQEDEMLAGQRGSRLAKWIATSDNVRQQAGLTAPEAMKIGKVVVLHTGTAEVALVHTMWPNSKKPKPCVQELPLDRVKCFRATILLEKEGSDAVSPTEFTWMYTPENVLAILDVMEADVASGKIVLTPSSKAALSTLKAQELPELEVKNRRKRRAKETAEKEASASSAKLSFKSVAKKVKMVAAASAAGDPSQADEASLIGPDDIRRSIAGRNAIKRFASKLLDLDALHFAEQPCFDLLSRECTLKVAKGYKRKDFLNHIPLYFQYEYFSVRSPEHYGHKVHCALTKILVELQNPVPERKGLQKLIADCKSCKLKGSVQA